jgi:hypothetical protein
MCKFNVPVQLEHWSENKVCALIQLFNARTMSAVEIHYQLKDVYGKNDTSQQRAAK